MNIAQLCKVKLNEEQNRTAADIEEFLNNPDSDTYLLKGHAGTGKTTLLHGVIEYLKKCETSFVLLASTGRAAKILSEKTGHITSTVHRHIYQFELDEMDDVNEIRKLVFRLKTFMPGSDTVFIIDESSMISDHKTSGGFVKFGTGRLLTDLFKYIGDCKVIFTGDPSQLPPVNLQFSPALLPDYLSKQHNRKLSISSLSTSMRHSFGSGIGWNTDKLRDNVVNNFQGYLQIKASSFADIKIHYKLEEMATAYAELIRKTGIENVIFITFSNKQAAGLNEMIRANLFNKKNTINVGEILMVFANNYLHDIANGEHLTISKVGETVQRAGLTFREIEAFIKEPQNYRTFRGLVIEEMLFDESASLGTMREHALFKDFAIRMNTEGINPKKQPDIYLTKLLTDPFLNAIRAKFGYAVTCHKAQGGEWDNVFMLIEKGLFHPEIKPQIFRWSYTAVSRAVKQLHILDNYAVK